MVYVGKDKTEYLLAYKMKMLPEDELLDDNILEELKPFITEWTVSDNDSITLPVGGICDFTVDYGDGSGKHKVTGNTDEDITHIYEKAGTYTITITGKSQIIDYINYGTSSRDKLTKIVQWGAIDVEQIRFFKCTNLVGPIPEPSKNSFLELTDVTHMFYGCNNLQCEIPEKLFEKCINVTSFNSVFRQNSYIEGPIPEKLFVNNKKAVDFGWAFQGSRNIKGKLSPDLFKNNVKATNFEYCFSSCSKLTGEAPNLWQRENVTSYKACFNECYNLLNYSEIPDIWKYP